MLNKRFIGCTLLKQIDGMELKNYTIVSVVLITTLLAGYGIYFIGIGFLQDEKSSGYIGQTKDPEKIFLAALEKRANYSEYIYEEIVNTEDDYPNTNRIVESENFSLIINKNAFFEKILYSNSTADVFCVKSEAKIKCSLILENSTLKTTSESMKSILFRKNAKKEFEMKKLYIKKGIIKFLNESNSFKTLDTKNCSIVKFKLDFSNSTLNDFNDIEMSPNSPIVLFFTNHTLEYCIDNESNILSVKWDYYFANKKKTSETKFVYFKPEARDIKEEFEFPVLVNEEETYNFYSYALNVKKTILGCTTELCIKMYAIGNSKPDICLFAGTLKDSCILMTAPKMLRADLCEKVDNSSFVDDCWIEMAAQKKDNSLCLKITENAKKDYCISLVEKNTSSECKNNNECFKAGCGSELCVPENQKGTITTCEVKKEYECLNFTRCGCFEGKCSWEQNVNYTNCLANLSR